MKRRRITVDEMPAFRVEATLSVKFFDEKVGKKIKKLIKKSHYKPSVLDKIGEIDGHDVYRKSVSMSKTAVFLKDGYDIAAVMLYSVNKGNNTTDGKYIQNHLVAKFSDNNYWMLKAFKLVAKVEKVVWVLSSEEQLTDGKRVWDKWLTTPAKYGWEAVGAFKKDANKNLQRIEFDDVKDLWVEIPDDKELSDLEDSKKSILVGVKV